MAAVGLQRLAPLLLVLAALVPLCSAYNNGVGRLPPMGWNTWCTDDACGLIDKCTEKEIKSVADAMVDQGLHKLGYQYINMDDCWSAKTRDANGELQPDPKQFPNGIKPVADYIHSKGLKFGLYLCVGTQTCRGGRPGSYGHYEQDAKTIAGWGMDYAKFDNCHKPSNLTEQEAYTQVSKALNATGRPILFSLCEWGNDNVTAWGGDVGQVYRIQEDHLPFWSFPSTGAGQGIGQGTGDIIEYMATLNLSNLTRQYAYPDPDFLMTLFPVTMNYIDSRTEFSFWCLFAAPLLVATDIRDLALKPQMASIITNTEAIAVNQDPAAHGGDRLLKRPDGAQVWAKKLGDGSTEQAVILYNSHDTYSVNVGVTWDMLGWSTSDVVAVRDLWQHEDVGSLTNGINGTGIAAHDVRFFRVTRKQQQQPKAAS